jgi:hypothetical protein
MDGKLIYYEGASTSIGQTLASNIDKKFLYFFEGIGERRNT